ncbi:MAG: lipase [Salinivirgaceae bacterium]|nr:lipase [Salinivirgaceae bacterium]
MSFISILTLLAVLATNPAIEYNGRIDFSKPEAPQFSYSGVSIRANIDAATVSATLKDEIGGNRFAVVIDKVYAANITTQKGKATYQLAQFAEKGVHEIEIVRITEERFGKTTFMGFELDEGGSIAGKPEPRPHTIEFIGNSITCGYGNEGRIGQQFSAATENHYMTYAAMTARSLNAGTIVAAKSGIGVYRNYAGPATGNPDCMTNLYDRTFLNSEKPKYDFAKQPDLVCINLGTNDMSTPGYDTALFIGNYLRLIGQVQQHYPKTDIVCLLGTMLDGPVLDTARHCINEVVRRANAQAKGNVYFFEMTPQNIDANGLGIDWHPTVRQHILSARQLTGYISELKGWNVVPQIVMAKVSGSNQITLYANTAECLFSESLTVCKIIADGRELRPTDWLINESNATMTIKFKENLEGFSKIELKGDNNVRDIMRCVVEKK